ncbi:tripartite tricarboxylate transporter TctB family protein [Cryobacterium arcticum]|uniref:DUF1468 domain-containing protein n=1 Tax=Cryobacterium arcticum TaxID=670052 RepID=A0A317ZP87_9MICO|nr:tripartite tricarboxylate transporter TctB family protein [Cryobacterium arcticum]PXA68322.1 hypothetical protein CTB96_17040 [Cryobacterium arcticum]
MRPSSSTTSGRAGATDAGGERPTPAPRWPEITIALTAVALTGSVLLLANAIELRLELPGLTPRSWPTFLGALGLGLSLILLITALVKAPRPSDDNEATTRAGWIKLLLAVAATIVFIVVWPLTAFVVAAPVFVSAVTAIGGGRGIRALIIYPVVMTGALYAMFNLLLRVPL